MTRSMSNIVGIPMHFAHQRVWVMPYRGPMHYGMQFSTYQLGGWMELCVIRGYALSRVCIKRGLTVYTFFKLTNLVQKLIKKKVIPSKAGGECRAIVVYCIIQLNQRTETDQTVRPV